MAAEGRPLPAPLAALRLRPLAAADLERATALEVASYPADEAATPEKLQYRLREAPELFYGVYEAGALVGFVVSTAAAGEELAEETMSTHTPGGESICVHSVVVAASHRRRGIALAMVRAYVEAVAADARCGAARRMLLLAKANLLGLYRKAGFEVYGPSKVVHGADQWFDLGLDLALRRRLDFMQVDAFSSVPLAGNPAAVLFTHRGGDEAWMQAVANENNLAETAFVERRLDTAADSPASEWDIRWFTPMAEVALCGHATLGSAHALWASGRVPAAMPVKFHTRKAGTLQCSRQGDLIQMDFPAQLPSADMPEMHDRFCRVLGVSRGELLAVCKGPATTPDWLVELRPEAFAGYRPDLAAIAQDVPDLDRGLIVTSAGAAAQFIGNDGGARPLKRPRVLEHAAPSKIDFVSRFFAPTIGVPEDPVTGSAHCILAPYWASKLGSSPGSTLTALQASPRGGVLEVRFDAAGDRVELRGQAVTVLSGHMTV